MNLAILSLFRDSMWYLDGYTRQVNGMTWDGPVRVYAVEGDSMDDTPAALRDWAAQPGKPARDVRVITYNHGYRKFGSCQNPIRLKLLAQVANAGLDAIAQDHWADAIWFVDSDYRWEPDTAARLVAHGKRAIAAYPMAESKNRGTFFYDTWGWFWRGRPFRQWGPPYHPFIRSDGVHPVDTVGGNLLFDAALCYAGARMTEAEPIRGLCHEIAARGVQVWGDPATRIWHLYPWSVAR